MNIDLAPGKYVAAVSGGVDSMVMLDLLARQGYDTVVAHFDHGIREGSAEDRKFVEKIAKEHGLRFFYEEGRLGPDAGEALARAKRYEFLEKIKNQTKADAILTAHHQDDALETVVINLIRGTGRKGLSSLKNRAGLARPLLNYTKPEILDYARLNKLEWHEDETNSEEKYLRNHVRLVLLPKFSEAQKEKLLSISLQSEERNHQIDEIITGLLPDNDAMQRNMLVSLSHDAASEILAQWLRNSGARLDKKTIERLVIALKTAAQGKIIQVNKDRYFMIDKGVIRLKAR